MRYVLLIDGRENALNDAEREACCSESIALARQLDAAGQYVAAAPLKAISTASSVRGRESRS